MSKKFPYPETKTPVPSRKNNAREAPKTSHVLSGLTPNRFGSGGLKPGGAANVTDDDDGERLCFCSSSVLTETEVLESEELGVALTETVVLFVFRSGNGLRTGGGERLRAVAMVFRCTEWRESKSFGGFRWDFWGFYVLFFLSGIFMLLPSFSWARMKNGTGNAVNVPDFYALLDFLC